MTTYEKLRPIIAESLGISENKVTPEASFKKDLDADSLDFVDLVMEMENHFGIGIPDSEAAKFKTVGDAVNYINSHLTKTL